MPTIRDGLVGTDTDLRVCEIPKCMICTYMYVDSCYELLWFLTPVAYYLRPIKISW